MYIEGVDNEYRLDFHQVSRNEMRNFQGLRFVVARNIGDDPVTIHRMSPFPCCI